MEISRVALYNFKNETLDKVLFTLASQAEVHSEVLCFEQGIQSGMEHPQNTLTDNRLITHDTLAPLEYLARSRCVINFIDCDEVSELFANRGTQSDEENTVLRYLERKILKLRLPRLMNEKLIRTAYLVANELNEWIAYHDQKIFNVARQVHQMAFRHLEAIAWTSLGTIDYFISAENLIKRNFSEDVKFRIAHAYGLQNYMTELSHKLMKKSNYLKTTFVEHERDLLQRSALYYWICYVHSNSSEVENVYGYGIRSCIRIEMFFFNLFVQMPNYVLIKNIWNELTSAERIDRVLDLVTTSVSSDLQLYFLSQLSAEDQRTVIRSRVPYVYKILVNDYYVRSFYDKLIEYIWDIMTYKDFIQIIELLFKSVNNTEDVARNKCKQIFTDLWSSASIPLRYQALEYDYDRCLRTRLQHNRRYARNLDQRKSTLLPRKWINNEDIVELVLLDATHVQRKLYLKTNASLAYAIQMIKKGKWAALEMFVKKFLPDHEDVLEFKSDMLRGDAYELVKHFYEADHNVSEHFYRWCFESKPRMEKFLVENRQAIWNAMNDFFVAKENIYKTDSFLEWCLLSSSEQAEWLNKFKIDAWQRIIIQSPKIGIFEVEYFLDWSFKTADRLYKSKYVIPSYQSLFCKYICILIKENRLKLLNELFNWCFLYNQQNIQKFKTDFLKNCQIYDFADLVTSMVLSKNDFRSFNNFFGSWFVDEGDFKIFKLKVIEPKIASWIAAEFVSKNKLKMADIFFKQCFKFNNSQLNNLKLKILADECMKDIVKDRSTKFVSSFMEWIDPPVKRYFEFEHWLLNMDVASLEM